MTRSQFQEGPATDHYHDTLGVDLLAALPLAVTRIGPFHVTKITGVSNGNDTLINGLAELGADTIVIRSWAVMREPWDATAKLSVRLSDTEDESGPAQTTICEIELGIDDSFAAAADVWREISTGAWAAPSGLVYALVGGVGPDGGWLIAEVPEGSTTGSIDIYAIVATPAT